MQEELELLKELQELDKNLQGARQKREKLEEEQGVWDADLERVQDMIDRLDANLRDLRDQRGDLNQSLSAEQDNIARAEERLPAIKTQKEYVAVLKEVDTAKKLTKDLQDRLGEADREIGALEADREEKVGERDALAEKVGARREEVGAGLAEIDQILSEGEKRRNELFEGLPKALRKRYQLLLDRRQGLAVVEARNGTCLGCNMQLPPQLFNTLFSAAEVKSCPHCNRLLYLEAVV